MAAAAKLGHAMEQSGADHERLEDLDLEAVIANLQRKLGFLKLLKPAVLTQLNKFAMTLASSRPPRVVLFGGTGAGKSTIINMFMGDPEAAATHPYKSQTTRPAWYRVTGTSGSVRENSSIDVLDTVGLFNEKEDPKIVLDAIKQELLKKPADVVVFVIDWKRMRGQERETSHTLNKLMPVFAKCAPSLANVPVIPVLTKCDLCEPERCPLTLVEPTEALATLKEQAKLHFNSPVVSVLLQQKIRCLENSLLKQKMIASALESIDDRLEKAVTPERKSKICDAIGISKHDWDPTTDSVAVGKCWNIDVLTERIFSVLPEEARVELCGFTQVKEIQKKLCRALTLTCVGLSTSVGIIPIEFGSPLLTIPLLAGLVWAIAAVSGRKVSGNKTQLVKEFFGALKIIGFGTYVTGIATAISYGLAQFVPGLGQGLNAMYAGVLANAIGAAAEEYFVDGNSDIDFKRLFQIYHCAGMTQLLEKRETKV